MYINFIRLNIKIKMEMVDALLYQYSYVHDIPHMLWTTIDEIYIPKYNIIFNNYKQLNVFKGDKPRNIKENPKWRYPDSYKERAKTEERIRKIIEKHDAKNSVPDEETPITKIQIPESLVNDLLKILEMEEFKKKVLNDAKNLFPYRGLPEKYLK